MKGIFALWRWWQERNGIHKVPVGYAVRRTGARPRIMSDADVAMRLKWMPYAPMPRANPLAKNVMPL